MIYLFTVACAALAVFSTVAFLVLHHMLTKFKAENRELWQLSINAGMERYRHAQSLHRQIDALALRCMEHGDSGPEIAEVLRAASAVRSS